MHNWQQIGHHWRFFAIFGGIMATIAAWGLRQIQPVKYAKEFGAQWRQQSRGRITPFSVWRLRNFWHRKRYDLEH